MKKSLLTIVCVLLVTSLASAQATTAAGGKQIHIDGGVLCDTSPILPTDGWAIQDTVYSLNYAGYRVHLKDGHSYSAEVYDSTDGAIYSTPQLTLFSSPGCHSTLTAIDVTGIDPDLSNNFAERISWIQSGNADAVLVVNNSDNHIYKYNIRVVDTTLHNPRWSTFSGFGTQYAFVNNTSATINGTLTVYDHSGTVLESTPLTVPASGENFHNVSAAPDHYGFATFAFVGPPGAVTADAYFINASATIIVPSSFGPRNYQH